VRDSLIDVAILIFVQTTLWGIFHDFAIAQLWGVVVLLVRAYQRHWRKPPYGGDKDSGK
jgi:hypothetical protein